MTLGLQIAVWRTVHKVSQAELASRVGVEQSSISKIESGRQKRIDRFLLVRIAIALEEDSQVLFDLCVEPQEVVAR